MLYDGLYREWHRHGVARRCFWIERGAQFAHGDGGFSDSATKNGQGARNSGEESIQSTCGPATAVSIGFSKGNLLLESSLPEAEKAFRTALEVGLKRDEEKAAVMLNLAAIQSSKRRTKEAKALIVQAKRLDKKGMLKGDIRTIEQMVNNPQQVMRRR